MTATAADRVREQYRRNADQLEAIAREARAVAPRKHRGATAEYWEERAAAYRTAANGGPLPPPRSNR